jgi:SAM-dependent methyltransferase
MDGTKAITAAPTEPQSPPVAKNGYLLAGQDSELERLLLQSRVWEPSGRQLLSRLNPPADARVADVGCGALGWLRLLSHWVGPSGQVVGTDIDHKLLAVARSFLDTEGIGNVDLVIDDLFDTHLQPRSFDLVHARYVIAPLGRAGEQVVAHRRLVKPGGWLILEEWDCGSWHYNPPAPAIDQLIRLFYEVFADLGGQAGRQLPTLLHQIGAGDIHIDAHVIALEPGHPYLRMPLQFSQSLQPRLEQLVSADELAALRRQAETELADPTRWATTFTLIQAWGKIDHHS